MSTLTTTSLADEFRSEAAILRREQLSAATQAIRERAAKQARYLENAAQLLDLAMKEAGIG